MSVRMQQEKLRVAALSPPGEGVKAQKKKGPETGALGGDLFKVALGGSGRSTKKGPVGAATRGGGRRSGVCLQESDGPCFKRGVIRSMEQC